MDGYTSSANRAVHQAQLPMAGVLTYADLVAVETEARALLKANKDFRENISPYNDQLDFDRLVRHFDDNGGWGGTRVFTGTLLARIENC